MYTIELTWDERQSEFPIAYLCCDGVRIALLYEDPVLRDDVSHVLSDDVSHEWTNDLEAWEPGPASKKLLDLLKVGMRYYPNPAIALLLRYGFEIPQAWLRVED